MIAATGAMTPATVPVQLGQVRPREFLVLVRSFSQSEPGVGGDWDEQEKT